MLVFPGKVSSGIFYGWSRVSKTRERSSRRPASLRLSRPDL